MNIKMPPTRIIGTLMIAPMPLMQAKMPMITASNPMALRSGFNQNARMTSSADAAIRLVVVLMIFGLGGCFEKFQE